MVFRTVGLTNVVFSQLAMVVWSDTGSIAHPPDQWGLLNFGPDGCAGDCPACQGVCMEDSDCLGDLVCFHRTDSTPIFGCRGGDVTGDVPGYDYCAYAKSTTVCAAKPPHLNIDRRRQRNFNLIGCFKQQTDFTAFSYKENFEVSFTLATENFFSKCKAECASFCYMALHGQRCSCSNSPRWVGSHDAVLGTFKCESKCHVYGGCGGKSGTKIESVWSNGDLKTCAEHHTKHWARPLSPGKFCSSTEKKKCSSGGSTSVKVGAKDSEKCRDSCEKSVECGGYTFATSGSCTHYAWSNDLKEVASSNGEISGMCDHASVEEFSLIGCFVQGSKSLGGGPQFLHDASPQMVFGPQDKDKDVVRKCKIFCHHTCYMAIVRDRCYCSDDPQLNSAFSQHPDILCSSTGGNGNICSVKYGCGSGNQGGSTYQSVYSNNHLKSSKCRGKTIWGKMCSFQVGVDANGFIYKTIKKTSAALCHQECEKDSKCGCFTHMPDMCHLKPKGVSCVLKQYEASCAFTAGTCSIKSENANVEKTMSVSGWTEAANFGVMGKVTIENIAGGSLSAKGSNLKGAASIVSDCTSGFSGVCKWEFHKSRLSWDGAVVGWDIKAEDKNLFVHVKNSLKGLKDNNKMSLEECKNPDKRCSWVLEPSPYRTGHYYIRTWGGNTYLKKSSDKTARLDACDSKGKNVPECQWKVNGLNPPKLKNPDAIKPHLRYTVYTRGLKDRQLKRYASTKMILHNCLTRGPWYDCFFEFVKSEASTGDHPVWYMKSNLRKTNGATQAEYMMMASKTVAKMGLCKPVTESLYRPRECQWVLEEKEKGKYMIRNLAVEGYLHVEGTVEEIKQKTMPGAATSEYEIKYGACADTAKCTWEFSTLGFPSRIAFDAMMTVTVTNEAPSARTWMIHARSPYTKVGNTYPAEKQDNKITMNTCTSGGNDKKWQWRCMYQFEKSGKKVGHTDIWYIRQWNGYIDTGGVPYIGPLVYVSVPVNQQSVNGVPQLSTCEAKGGYRPEECQWILEPLEIAGKEEDTLFQMRNVAVSNKLSGQKVYLGTSSTTVKFMTCSPEKDKKCQWKVNPIQANFPLRKYEAMNGLCLPRKVKPVVGYQAYGTNGIHYSKTGAEGCNLKCAGRKDCVGYVVTPGLEGNCRLKVQMFPLTVSVKRVSNIMIGENLGCGSRQLTAKDSKSKVVPVFDFRLAGCVGLATAPAPFLSDKKKYTPDLLVGACMEFCKDSCGMMVGWQGAKCSCFDTEPVAAAAWPLDKCNKCKPGNGCGGSGAASVYVNMQNKEDKCKRVTKPPVDAAKKGTKHCSVIVGMQADVALTQNTAVALQKKTAEECATKCESTEECAGYTFDDVKKCYFFKWDVEEWKPVDAPKHVTGTCDEKPAEDFTLIGCYKKGDLNTKFVKYSSASDNSQIEKCSRWCRDTCYMAIVQRTCACGNDMSSVAVQTDSKCNYAASKCNAVKGGCGGTNHAGVHANNVLRKSSKCSGKKPWRRLCTKEKAMKVLGEELKVHSKKTVGWCHQACEKDSQCGCFTWDPVKSGCHLLKTTATDQSKQSEQCKTEQHEGMFRLVSGTCQ